jgi:multiple sugar transport system permease protein
MAIALRRQATQRGEVRTKAQRERIRGTVMHGVLILLGLIMLYPLLWMVSSSFKPTLDIFDKPGLWPEALTTENYTNGWNAFGESFGTFFRNSFIVAGGAVVGTLISSSLAAFAFARLNFRFKRFWFALMMGTIMLPGHVLIVPEYILFLKLGWVNTFLPLIVPRFLATNAFFIFLIVQFIRGIPRDLDDAAKIDGASVFRIYWDIILPLSVPALATAAIFSFLWTWDDFFAQLLYLSKIGMYTVPLGLRLFIDSTTASSWGPLFAMSILSLVPLLVIFILFQRFIIQGISTSGLKG